MTVKILGICGSPIEAGNTETILNVALKAAAELPDVETRFFTIAHKKFNGCIHCNWCVEKQGDNPEDKYCSQQDDLTPLYNDLVEADGILLATPVYFRSCSWQMAAIFSRQRCFITGKLYRNNPVMHRKIFGGISVAWMRNAGQEGALLAIHQFGSTLGLIEAGSVAAVSSLEGSGRRDRDKPGDKLLVLRDEKAIEATRSLGKKVAEICKKLKTK
ncbi:flavodoxin family protein [Chloroflexota bacterium]